MQTLIKLALVVGALVLLALLLVLKPPHRGGEQPTMTETKEPTVSLIPRDVLFGNPDKALVRLSPDGSKLAFLAPLDGVLNVWVAPADDPASAQPVTHDTGRGIRMYFWAYTNEHILYLQDKNGDENWRLYSVDLSSGDTIDLTPLEGVQARVQETSPKFPEELLIGLNDRDPRLHDLYRVNIETGERQLVLENEGFMGFTTDEDFNVRFAMRLTPDGGNKILQYTPDGDWKPFAKISMEDTMTSWPIGFDKTGRVLYMIDSRGRDTAALVAIDLQSGFQTVLAEDPQADISDALVHPTEKTIQAAASTYERKRWQILDPAIKPDFEYLKGVADGDFEVISHTLDDRFWVVAYIIDNGPVRYYLYDHENRQATFLFTNRKDLEGLPLAKMHPVIIEAHDGLKLVSYLTLPIWTDPDGDGRPTRPLPTVLWVHGGPWARDTWGYDPYHQWLANRGYAVLSVNFRGSTGFGKAFINAGNREWGRKMHDDLIDAVEWAVREGIAQRDKVAIMGGSYGGYATLIGLTFTPDAFACGVDIVGPSNLVTLLESIPPYWEPLIELWATRVGDPRTEEGRKFLRERSPLTYVDRIQKPLLIGHGANDPRVKQKESEQIVQAMQEKGIPVTYVLYPDEGHGFARPENRLSFNAIAEAFLAQCLGGRFEPIGDDFQDSSLTVPVGTDYVPGLKEALEVLPAK
jgi:dipeptidyl aminopeptidase/acylaminoacyl peptidase